MQRPPLPSFLATEEPLDALCHHFNVARAMPGPLVPTTFDMPVLRNSRTPTHVQHTPALMLPIDASSYEHGFRVELNIPTPGGTTPVPRQSENPPELIITLPVIPIIVPHPASFPLLLLFGMGLETQYQHLSCRLLPAQVVGEFREDYFERYYRFTEGLWKNILALGPRNPRLTEVVSTAWNVSGEARP
ncbi:hypothetical protein BDQ17DRAFT_1387489 [Cyathus striatus]|nr:hypothetical protein BDQ17DRAFT_1387489 [Cyathus striatus]